MLPAGQDELQGDLLDMNPDFFQWRTLQTRVTLFSLIFFLASLWALAFYASYALRDDMERTLGEQQFASVSLIADQVNSELADRMAALKLVADEVSVDIADRPVALQRLLEQRALLKSLFNGGVMALRRDGTAMADVPFSAGRMGVNYLDVDSVAAALKDGQSTIGRPVIGKTLKAPVFNMATPIRNAEGQVTGALLAVINLGKPNFLDKITQLRPGSDGGYLLLAPQHKLVVTATDKSRIMQAVPEPGINLMHDKYMAGFEGHGIAVSSHGVEELSAARRIGQAGWLMVSVLPTAEAFAPIYAVQQRMLFATIFLSLVAGGMIWWLISWILRRQLLPLLSATQTMADWSDSMIDPQVLPVTRPDEIGELLNEFNRLLHTLGQRENALKESESRFRTLADNASALVWIAGVDKLCYYFNKVWFDFTGRSLSQEQGNGWAQGVHAEDLQRCMTTYVTAFDARRAFCMDYRLRRHDGVYRWLTDQGVPRYDDQGVFLGFIGTCIDITDRINAEKFEKFRSHILELLVGGETLPRILHALALGVEQVNPGMLCSIMVLHGDGKRLEASAAPSLPDFYNAASDGLEIGIGAGSCGTAAFTGERVIVEDIQTHPYWTAYKELAAKAGLGSCWSQPIRSSSGQVLGTFAIYHREVNTPLAADISMIEQSAHLASIAIERSLEADKLSDSEGRFRSLMENIPNVAVQGYTCDGHVMFWNKASEQLYGYSHEEAMGKNLLDLIIPPEMTADVAATVQHMFESGEPTPAAELLLKTKSGARVPVFSSHALVSPIGRLPEMFCLDLDLTERKQSDEKLKLAASVFTHAREGIMITSASGTVIDVNEAFTRITGYSREDVLGRNPSLLSSGRQDKAFYAELWCTLIEQGQWRGEIWNRRKSGEVYAEMQTISAVRDARGVTQHYVALFSDITDLKAHESELERIAHFDALTNLPNRSLLADRLSQATAQALRRGQQLAVVFLDLDGFKAVNDQHGHDAGDYLLITLANRMKQTLREGDTLARLGGDEFVALFVDLDDIEDSKPMLRRLLDAAAQPVAFGEVLLQVTASLGVTFYPQQREVAPDQLLRQADQAMYQAKLAGKNRCNEFDAETH